MDLFWIYLISTINVLVISISLTFFLIKGYQHVMMDIQKKEAIASSSSEAGQAINDQMSLLLKSFTVSFIVLEVGLIFYFIFWSVLFYLQVA